MQVSGVYLNSKSYVGLFILMTTVMHCTLYIGEPLWLLVVLRGDGKRVQKYQENDQPVKHVRLHGCATLAATQPIPPSRITTVKIQRERKGYKALLY